MAYDVVIRGGALVDGSGAEPVRGDLAIKDGLIAKVGVVDGEAKTVIDAEGCLVTPGFIDLHTHLDAQIGWDPALSPVSRHGVTTALMGNCGVTFAPCREADRPLLAAMMETVEDIPRNAILTGLPWTWEDYGGYLDALDTMAPSINVAGLVGHSAVRWYVMGERSVEEQATPEEVARMAQIVGEALDRGAVGFSTNRLPAHVGPDGRSIPGTFADPAELVEIGKAVAARGGIVQAVGAGLEVIRRVADESGARVLFSYGVGASQGAGKAASDALDAVCEGRDITAIAQTRGSGFMFGLQAGLPFSGDTWRRLRRVPLEERLAAIRDPETFAILADEARHQTRFPLEDVFYLGAGETPDYVLPTRASVKAMCELSGESFVELFMRLSRETDGKGLFVQRMFCKNLSELSDLLTNRNLYPGLGDAGAHVSQVMDADWATFVLSHWVKREGLYSVGEAIRRFTSGPARVMGLADRGLLREGLRADINVIDYPRLTSLMPRIVHDFPFGAARYVQDARGYKATIVNGEINVLDDELTGARAGRVLRHQQAREAVPA